MVVVIVEKMQTVNGNIFFGVARSLALKTELLDLSARSLSLWHVFRQQPRKSPLIHLLLASFGRTAYSYFLFFLAVLSACSIQHGDQS